MKSAQDIILKPIISERSAAETMNGRYTFVVAKNATKPEIRRAVEELFDVKVTAVNTQNYRGKKKRMGVHVGTTSSFKKAIVTIDMDPQEETYQGENGKTVTTGRKYKTSIESFGFGQ
ncbi:MAG TPA: 50S ribosomal protein L23 [Clostridiaceae bacterium]|nr:50S ribosomal protein L23 [Clostridiaceae bacterium]